MDTFNKSMTTVLSFSKDVNDIHISMAHLNSVIDSLNDQVQYYLSIKIVVVHFRYL